MSITRRQFLKSAAVCAVGAAAPVTVLQKPEMVAVARAMQKSALERRISAQDLYNQYCHLILETTPMAPESWARQFFLYGKAGTSVEWDEEKQAPRVKLIEPDQLIMANLSQSDERPTD